MDEDTVDGRITVAQAREVAAARQHRQADP